MPDPFDLDDDLPGQPGPPPPASPPWLEALNPEQRLAVETTEGPLLVLSGAGTGKTRVLTTRLAHILASRRARPWECLAVTFTNKAAREMRERVATLIGPVAEGVWLGTFHALGVRMLRRHAELAGLRSDFTILDSDDQLRLVKQVMETEAVDPKRWPAQALLAVIQRWKDRGLTPEKVGRQDGGDVAGGRAVELYARYQDRLRVLNAADFGDLLLHCLAIFQDPANSEVLAGYQRQFRYVLVDEYQDTNVAQYLWLRLLARGHRNICCVGDDDQSIYSWRGAEVGNILRFEEDFPGARIVRLERNYRSTPQILAAASGLIAHNEGRLGKTLRTGEVSAVGGEKLSVRSVWDGDEEARAVIDEIEALQRAGDSLSEMAILVRAGFQTRAFEERLITCGVPYRVLGGPRFYERLEVRDAIAYLRVVHNLDGVAFERIVNTPKRGVGAAALRKLHIASRDQEVSLVEAARRLVETDELPAKARGAIRDLLNSIDRWRVSREALPVDELAETVIEESGYIEMWRNDRSPEAPGRVENLRELIGSLPEFDGLTGFLEHVGLVMDNDSKAGGDRVTLMTLHGAKGLEFDHVFLPGWEEGLFPHQRALDESGQQGLEEERRLAYVGITRARRRVFVSHAANRRIYNQWQDGLPSRFIAELPAEHVESRGEPGLFPGGLAEPACEPWAGARRWETRGPVIEATSWRAVKREPAGIEYKPGDRVFHDKFGHGEVVTVDGNKLRIQFDKAGLKRLVDSFVRMA